MMQRFPLQEIRWSLRYARQSLRRTIRSWKKQIREWRYFWSSYQSYNQLVPNSNQIGMDTLYPCLGDNTTETFIEPVYFYQDAWAFGKIVQRKPASHVDIGSHHKYVALLSKVLPVTMVDLRPLSLPLDTLDFKEGSILDLPFENDSVDSISSLCVVEHIGLGRYGDELDPEGSIRAIEELKRILAPAGRLYLSVPVGDDDSMWFNAGRVFSLNNLMEILSPLTLIEQRYIVGRSYQEVFEPRKGFGTTGLFELTKS